MLDSETNEVRYTFVDTNTDLSKWIKEVPLNMYLSRICPKLKQVLMFGLWAWLTGVIKDLIGLDIAAKGDIYWIRAG